MTDATFEDLIAKAREFIDIFEYATALKFLERSLDHKGAEDKKVLDLMGSLHMELGQIEQAQRVSLLFDAS